MMFNYVFTIAVGYLLGSIPVGYLLVRIFRHQDIRQTGSGNIGATNVARSSPGLGILTLLLDGLKGFAAVLLARSLFPGHIDILFVAAFAAVVGHVFPVWLGFKGGKGVATGLGAFLILTPKAMLVMVGIFAVAVLIFRYISLGSILAVGCFPLLAWLLDGYRSNSPAIALMTLTSTLIIAKHHANIGRLLARTETRFGKAQT